MKAYVEKGYDKFFIMIQSPNGHWLRLDGWHSTLEQANEHIIFHGYTLITKDESFR